MEQRHSEKYAALRAAAEARQRQRGASASSASSAAVNGSASGGSAVASSLADGDARYARLQELQAQQRERKARSMAAGEAGGSSASKLEAASASGGIDAGGPPGTGAALPPRPRQPTASTAAAAGTIKNNYNGAGSFGPGAAKTATPAAKPPQRSARPKLYSTPGAAVLEPSREAEAGKGSLAAGSKYYATPLRKENAENAWRIPADNDAEEGDIGDGGAGGEALSPKTPMTMMRAVRASLGEDRTALETGRGGLFGTTGGESAAKDGPLDGARAGEGAEDEEHDAGLDDSKIEDAKSHPDEHPRRPISASCLPYPTEIILRVRHPAVLASLSVQPQSVRTSRGCFIANEAHGGLGGIEFRGENRFTISKDQSSDAGGLAGGAGEDGAMEEGEQDGEEDFSTVLCYGDKVTLRSNVLRRVLGVQKSKAPADNEEGAEGAPAGEDPTRLEVGCFRKEGRLGTAWTVLRGGANAPLVRLGTDDALDLDAAAVPGEGSETSKAWRKVPVYSGDPVVLRNEWTGGLLSLGTPCPPLAPVDGTPTVDDGTPPGWHLAVVTSAYQANEDGGASTADDRPLLEYLHEHRRFRPGRGQTFQLVAADVPACPAWAYPTGEGADRVYLHGGYLSHPDRHELEAALEGEVFPDAAGARGPSLGEFPPLAALPVDVQERILVDEVLGAMMGQEGRFVRYHLAGEDDDDDTESQSSEESQVVTAAGFGVAPASIMGGQLDPPLENLVARLLPLATNYAYVSEYVAAAATQYEWGAVARSLAEAISELLEEYLAFASDLDRRVRDERLSLSAVHVRARPSLRTMAVLSRAVAAARDKKGGALLNALHEAASVHFAGDEMGHRLLRHLLERAARPYAAMLRSWLAFGRVHDPYGEFMIEVTDRSFGGENASSSTRKGTEWHRWCRERPDHVPFGMRGSESDAHLVGAGAPGLDRGRATAHMGAVHKAHAAGKYWRAIRRCREGGEMNAGAEPSSVLAGSSNEEKKKEEDSGASSEARALLNPLQLSRSIDRAYHEASDAMLRLLLHDHGLLSSLRFMKKYFLLDQGDFFVDFLDGAESELHKELPDVLRGRVQNWLSTSLARTADATSPGLAAALRCTFHNSSLRDTLDDLAGKKGSQRRKKAGARPKVLAGFEAIAFEFKAVPFPASIVLSEPQLRIYQLVFRLIFFAKCVERRLVNMWSDHQGLKGMPGLRSACGPTFSLRRRMLHFIQNFVYYLKFDVIEPGWRELEDKLRATKEYCREGAGEDANARRNSTTDGRFPRTVDDLIHHHNDFLIRTSNQCLLTNYDLVDRASKIMTTCLLFATQIQRFLEATKVRELHERTRHERSKLRYGPKRRKDDGAREAEFRADREERTRRCADGIEAELHTETYRHMISRFDEVFSAHLAEFVRNLESDRGRKDNAHLSNLSLQLDYNGFLSSSMQGAKK